VHVRRADTDLFSLHELVFHNSDLNHIPHNFINIDAPLATARSL
jgi:hypothetical protein